MRYNKEGMGAFELTYLAIYHPVMHSLVCWFILHKMIKVIKIVRWFL